MVSAIVSLALLLSMRPPTPEPLAAFFAGLRSSSRRERR